MDIEAGVNGLSAANAKKVLTDILKGYLSPAFGALPKREIDLLLLDALESIGLVDDQPDLYKLMTGLKVTRSKARALLYDRELRRLSSTELDTRMRALLRAPALQKQGDLFVLEIDSPLVADHLRAKVKSLGHASDGSFSPSLVKLGIDAMVALIDGMLTADERRNVKAALVEAGAPDASFRGVLKGSLKAVGKLVASEAGSALAESVSDYVAPIIDANVALIGDRIGQAFAGDE
jgi:hypothetical protein